MELREYIVEAEKTAGSQKELKELLGLAHMSYLSNAKSGQRGLPVYACIELAKLINVDPMEVISASELVTEKNEKRKAIFLPFVQVARNAHHLAIAGLTISIASSSWIAALRDYLACIANSMMLF